MKDTKQYIISIAYGLFLKKTFKEVTMKELVEVAELSKGALYHYFSSKEDLFNEVIKEYLIDNAKINFDTLNDESLKTFYQSYCKELARLSTESNKYDQENGNTSINHFILIFEAIKLFPEVRKKFETADDEDMGRWIKVINKAKTSKEINSKMNSESIAKLFIFSNDALGMRRLIYSNKTQNAVLNKSLLVLWNDIYKEFKI